MKQTAVNPVASFYDIARKKPDNIALWVDGMSYTYSELATEASRIAAWVRKKTAGAARRTAILANRTLGAYQGILGACWAGTGYIPLNPLFPEKRLLRVLDLSRPDVLLVTAECLNLLTPAVIKPFGGRILILDNGGTVIEKVTVAGSESLPRTTAPEPPAGVAPEADAYLVFTSGTTGTPKGLAISAGNLAFAVKTMQEQFHFSATDRFSQFFELSFDFSVMDLFVPWQVGASTHVVPAGQKLGPNHFIVDRELTVWTCVPSMISFMDEMRMLRPNAFPSLRFSCFSGAPLSRDAARKWQEAAPGSTLINLYGQTEGPIGSMAHQYLPQTTSGERKYVPLGKPFPDISGAILESDGNFAETGGKGELVLAGPHIAAGYLNNPEENTKKFREMVHPRLGQKTWYLTGDRVEQDLNGIFHFLGRTDNEVKISGERIMLEEVEFFLQQSTGCSEAAVVVWYNHLEVAEAVIGFVTGKEIDEAAVKKTMARDLPRAAVPRRIFTISRLPLNPNGKIDRKALAEQAAARISL
ncbi:MAG: AMP-binding protein [Deltaproteobacteria bacterium]|jgi:amino acid adenylation domain-containing protein|nr:AMP-binding protein [Deltaproteobacteria bacterium]